MTPIELTTAEVAQTITKAERLMAREKTKQQRQSHEN